MWRSLRCSSRSTRLITCSSSIFFQLMNLLRILNIALMIPNDAYTVMAVLLLGLWVAAAVVILTPHYNIASTISSTGVEEIVQANLFFFTWFATFCNVYLVGSFFRDYRTYDLRVMGWASVLAASLMLVGISNHLKQGICDIEDGATCFRIKYSMTAAVALSVFSCIASVLSYKSLVKPKLGLVLASPTAVIYCFSLGKCSL